LGFYYLEIAEMKFRQWLLIVQKIVEYAKIVSQTNDNYNERERV
jgi:DNA polymerase III alpha subunit